MKINKKQIGLIAGLACIILLIVVLLTMCNGSGNGDHQGETINPTASVENTTPVMEAPTEASEETTEPTEETTEATEETTEATEETTAPTTGGNTTPGGSGGYVPDYGTGDDDDDDSSGPVTETAPAAGSKDSPYVENVAQFPDTFSSVAIPTDSTIYHHVYGAEGGVLTIEDAEAYVIYNEVSYEPNEYGIVSVPLVPAAAENQEDTAPADETDSDTEAGTDQETEPLVLPQIFQLGSRSAEARSFVLSFNAPLGSQQNPENLEAVDGVISIEAALEAGDVDGYYYSYTAVSGGILTLQVDSATENVDYDIIVTVGETVLKLSESEEGLLTVDMPLDETILIQLITIPGADGIYPAAQIKILGQIEDTSGTKENPILIPGEFPVLTGELEPKTEVYYSVFGASGMILTIEDPDAYVIIGEDIWTAVDGVVSGEVVSANPREPVLIGVGNGADTTKSYTVNFDYKPGTMMKPAQLLTDAPNTAVVAAGSVDGYWYTWTAQEDGILTITLPDGNWMYQINHVTDSIYGDIQYSDGEEVSNLVETEVSAGDELNIMICTYDPADPFNIPAGQIVFEAIFNTKPGTKENPIWLTELETSIEVKPEFPVYCNLVMSGVTMEVRGEGTFTVTYDGTNYAAVNGVVTIPDVAGDRYAPIPMILSNYGRDTVTYTVTFIYPVGSSTNPQLIELMGEYVASVGDNGESYFYNWIAPSDGQFTVSMLGDDWTFAIHNLTTYIYGEIHNSQEGSEPAESIAVVAGDLIQISVSTASGKAKDVILEVDFYDPTLGTSENPVWLTELENTVTVRPGSSVYTNLVFSGVTMTVTGTDPFALTYNGIDYVSEDGIVIIHGVSGSRFTPAQMILTNPGTEKAEYNVAFVYPVGSHENPEVITEMGEYTASVVGDGEGYFYTWTAETDGVFTITMKSDDWTYVMHNLTGYVYGEIQDSRAGGTITETIEVKAGDEIQINIGTSSRQNKEVIMEFDHYDPNLGTEENPIWLSGLENEVTLRAGGTIYCNVVLGGTNMTVAADGNYTVTLEGVGHPVVNGIVTVANVEASRFMPLQMVLTNPSEKKVNVSVQFAYPVGNMMNPAVITEMGEYSVIVEGDGEGYFFTWIAEADGAFSITMLGDDWVYVMHNLTSYNYGGIRDSASGAAATETIAVKAGDEIQINIGTSSRQNLEVPVRFSFQDATSAAEKESGTEDTVFEGSYTPKPFIVTPDELWTMDPMDLTQNFELYADQVGFYHLDSEKGPYVMLDFTDDTYVNLAELVESMELFITVIGEDGAEMTLSCNELLKQYMECAWVLELSDDVTRTLYPLTEDLELILKNLGEQLGWFDPDSDGYLFGNESMKNQEVPEEPNADSLWMFSCYCVEFIEEEMVNASEIESELTEESQESIPEASGSVDSTEESEEPDMA